MIFSRSLSCLLLPALAFLSLSARASPYSGTASRTSTLKLAARINSNGIKNIVTADRARFELLQAGGNSSISTSNVGVFRVFAADIGVGTPPTYCKLILILSFPPGASISRRYTCGRHWELKYLGWSQQILCED